MLQFINASHARHSRISLLLYECQRRTFNRPQLAVGHHFAMPKVTSLVDDDHHHHDDLTLAIL